MARGRRAALTAAALGLMLPALAAAGEGRWTSQGPSAEIISALTVDPSVVLTAFAATAMYLDGDPFFSAGELFKSEDGGAAWQSVVPSPRGTTVLSLAVDPENRLLYGLVSSGTLYQSGDGGASWRPRHAFGAGPARIAVDPIDPRTIYVFGSVCAAMGGCGPGIPVATIWRQRPGQDWEAIPIAGAGVVTALAIDPTVPGLLYAGTDAGIWKSPDNARHWEAAGRGTESGCGSVSALGIGPSGELLLGYFEHLYGFTECGAVYRSTDRATTWQFVRNLPYHALSFAFDAAHPGTAWAAAGDFFGSGVYRSLDGGASWESANEGLEGGTAHQVAIDASGETIYAATDAGVFDLEVPESSREVLPPASQRPATRSLGPRP
jgi:hypothetical protein